MPFESRLFVKTGLVAFVAAFVWGAWMAFEESLGRPVDPIWAIEHAHVAFVGWLVNMVMGFAIWLLRHVLFRAGAQDWVLRLRLPLMPALRFDAHG
jgi:hypothetical protein